MSIYAPPGVASVFSAFVSAVDGNFQQVMSCQYGTVDPTVKPAGTLHIKSNQSFSVGSAGHGLRWWDGSAWQLVLDLRAGAKCINDQGTFPMAADLDMGTNKVVNVVDPTSAQDAATKAYVDGQVGGAILDDGTVPMAADLDMDGNAIVDLAAPTNPGDAVNKTYCDLNTPAYGASTFSGTRRVTLGFTPARLELWYGGAFWMFNAAVNTSESQSMNGNTITVTLLNGSLSAPDDHIGFKVVSPGGITGTAFKYRAWKQ